MWCRAAYGLWATTNEELRHENQFSDAGEVLQRAAEPAAARSVSGTAPADASVSHVAVRSPEAAPETSKGPRRRAPGGGVTTLFT